MDKLKPFKNLSEKVVNRDCLKNCNSLMFFDYPADRETFDRIIEQAAPDSIHFMNYDLKYFDEEEFLKTFYGMLKYACNNNYGKVELRRCASYLGKSYNVFYLLFEILENCKIINIKEKQKDYYVIEMTGNTNISNILQSEKYTELIDLLTDCEQFQKSLLEDDLYNLVQ